jgi:hypothetical protein
VELGWSEAGRPRSSAPGGGGGASAVVSGGEGVGELQCTMGKLAIGSIGAEEGRGGVLHSEQGAAAAMAYGGATSVRAGARLGSRRSGVCAGRGEAAWNAKNCSRAVEDGRRGTPHGDPRRRKGHWRRGGSSAGI